MKQDRKNCIQNCQARAVTSVQENKTLTETNLKIYWRHEYTTWKPVNQTKHKPQIMKVFWYFFSSCYCDAFGFVLKWNILHIHLLPASRLSKWFCVFRSNTSTQWQFRTGFVSLEPKPAKREKYKEEQGGLQFFLYLICLLGFSFILFYLESLLCGSSIRVYEDNNQDLTFCSLSHSYSAL